MVFYFLIFFPLNRSIKVMKLITIFRFFKKKYFIDKIKDENSSGKFKYFYKE